MDLETIECDGEIGDSALNSVARVIFQTFPRNRWLRPRSITSGSALPGTESLGDLSRVYIYRMPANADRSLQIDAHTQIRYIVEDESHQVVLVGVESEEIEQSCCGPLLFVRTLHLYDAHGKEALRVKPVPKQRRSRLCAPLVCCCFAAPSRRGTAFEVIAVSAQLTGQVEDPQIVRIRQTGSCCRPRFDVELETRARTSIRMRVRSGALSCCGAVPEWRRETRFKVQFMQSEDNESGSIGVEFEQEPAPTQSGVIHFTRLRESQVDLDTQSLHYGNADKASEGRNGTRSRRTTDDEARSVSESDSETYVDSLRLRMEHRREQDDPLLRDCPDVAILIDASRFSAATRSRARLALIGVAYAIDTLLVRRSDSEFD